MTYEIFCQGAFLSFLSYIKVVVYIIVWMVLSFIYKFFQSICPANSNDRICDGHKVSIVKLIFFLQMNKKMDIWILILVLIGGKSHGGPHKMEDAANQEKNEPCGDDADCPENQNLLTAKYLYGDQEETGAAFRRMKEGLNCNFGESPIDEEAATHHPNLNERYENYKEACFSDDEDCDFYRDDDDDDDYDDDDDHREHRRGNENSYHRNSQPKSVERIPDNKEGYIYF